MKKSFAVLIILSAVAALLCGCKSEEDMIPEKLGAPEGLWLYKGNERMRTDGSEKERLLDEVTLGGVTYSADEYSIDRDNIAYCTDTQTIFYLVTVLEGESRYAVMYDYAGSVATEIGAYDDFCFITVSDKYVYINGYHDRISGDYEAIGDLYTHLGEPVAKGLKGELSRDFVGDWKYDSDTDVTTFTYWRNGETHAVSRVGWDWMNLVRDDVAYDGTLYATMGNGKVIVLNMDAEEFTEFSLEGDVDWYGVKMEDGIYFLAYGELKQNNSFGDKRSKYKLYRYQDGKVEKIADFPEKSEVSIDSYGQGVINFYSSSLRTYHYSVSEGTLKKKNVKVDTNEYFTCGEYTFWREDEQFGFLNRKTCCYLYRRHGDTVEVMQYSIESSPTLERIRFSFFDDIREA